MHDIPERQRERPYTNRFIPIVLFVYLNPNTNHLKASSIVQPVNWALSKVAYPFAVRSIGVVESTNLTRASYDEIMEIRLAKGSTNVAICLLFDALPIR